MIGGIFVKKLIAILALLSLFVTNSAMVYAKEQLGDNLGTKFVFNENYKKPKLDDPKEIDARIERINKGIFEAFALNKSMDDIDNYLKSEGFEKVSIDENVSANSDSTYVTYYKPSVYYDSYTGLYVINAAWAWKRYSNNIPQWYNDFGSLPGNMGGQDGAGLWVSNPKGITFKKFSMTTYDAKLGATNYTTPWDWNQYGVVFKGQDKTWFDSRVPGGYNYNWDSGAVVAWASVAGTGSTYLKTKLAHDWNSTDLSGCSISSTDISFTFNNTSSKWQGTSQPYTWTR